jgi:hypothetical protein
MCPASSRDWVSCKVASRRLSARAMRFAPSSQQPLGGNSGHERSLTILRPGWRLLPSVGSFYLRTDKASNDLYGHIPLIGAESTFIFQNSTPSAGLLWNQEPAQQRRATRLFPRSPRDVRPGRFRRGRTILVTAARLLCNLGDNTAGDIIFAPNQLSAAHRSLPFDSCVRVNASPTTEVSRPYDRPAPLRPQRLLAGSLQAAAGRLGIGSSVLAV